MDTVIIDDQNHSMQPYAGGVLSTLPISLNRISGSPRSLLHRFAMFSVAASIKNLRRAFVSVQVAERTVMFIPIFTKEFFSDFPVTVGENVITMYCYSHTIVNKALYEVVTL
jgi:hypothetical protein